MSVDIEKISEVDPGELLLTVAKNAEHITPEMQKAIAQFMQYWSAPRMTINPVNLNLGKELE